VRFLRALAILLLAPALLWGQATGAGTPTTGQGTATPGTINYTATGGSTPLTLQKFLDANVVDPRNYGVVMNTGTDQSAAMQNCINAVGAAGGGVIQMPPGIIKMNVVIANGGVVLQGQESGSISPVTDYLAPYDTTKPVIQIGADAGYIYGSGVRDLCVYDNTGLSRQGITFAGGAFKCFASNIHSIGFTQWCLGFTNNDRWPCSYNKVDRLSCISSSVATYGVGGGAGIAYIDKYGGKWNASVAGNVLTITTPATTAQAANPGVIAAGASISAFSTSAGSLNAAVIQPYGTSGTTGTGGAGTYYLSVSSTSWTGVITHNGLGWTTANYVVNFESKTSLGPQVLVESCSFGCGGLANGYLQGSYSGIGLTYMGTWTNGPNININGVDMDSVQNHPLNFGYVSVVHDCGSDLRVGAQWGNALPLTGTVNTGGQLYVIAGHTTGSITAGQSTVTVASTTGIRVGRQISIAGAGPLMATGYYMPLVGTVTAISGNVLTLDGGSTTAVVTVSNNDVGYGDITALETSGQIHSYLGTPGVIWTSAQAVRTGLASTMVPTTYRAGNVGSIAPWNSYSVVDDLATNPRYFLQTATTINSGNSATWSAGVVTFTCASGHNAQVGDLIYVDGDTIDAGINGTFVVAGYTSGTVLTYNSAAATGSGTATGTLTIRVVKSGGFVNGGLWLSGASGTNGQCGLSMRNNLGVVNNVINTTGNNAQLQINTPETTNGFFGLTYGSAITTGAGLTIGNSGANKFQFTGNGTFNIAEAAAPSLTSGWGKVYADSTAHQLYGMNAAGTKTMLTLDKTITTAGTTGAQTYNVSIGSIRIAAAGTSVVLTDSLITANSVVLCNLGTVDTTAKSVVAVPGAGSCTFTLNAAATAEVAIFFHVLN